MPVRTEASAPTIDEWLLIIMSVDRTVSCCFE